MPKKKQPFPSVPKAAQIAFGRELYEWIKRVENIHYWTEIRLRMNSSAPDIKVFFKQNINQNGELVAVPLDDIDYRTLHKWADTYCLNCLLEVDRYYGHEG